MKKYLIKNILLLALILFVISDMNLLAQFSGGTGTSTEPYLISSRKDMEDLADSVAQGNF
jgi:hypothetical protein